MQRHPGRARLIARERRPRLDLLISGFDPEPRQAGDRGAAGDGQAGYRRAGAGAQRGVDMDTNRNAPEDVDAYLAPLPEDQRQAL